jgi:hypothetical protein
MPGLRDFNVDSLVNAFDEDIKMFIVNYSGSKDAINDITDVFSLSNVFDPDKLSGLIAKKVELLRTLESDLEDEKIADMFEYSREIHEVERQNPNVACQLFVIRHLIFFQILIFMRLAVSSKAEFDKVLGENFGAFLGHNFKMSYNQDYQDVDFNKFKLGIWGSVNVTSDIDVGFQYAEISDRKIGIIAYVLELFESAFLHFTGRNTLAFDIEGYADLMYMDTDPTIFYCNSSDFTFADLLTPSDDGDTPSLISSVVSSMIRNHVQAKIDKGDADYDIRRKTQKNDQDTQKIKGDINSFTLREAIANTLVKVREAATKNDAVTIQSDQLLHKLIKEETVIDTRVATDYLTKPYNDGRKVYYAKVLAAETFLANHSKSLLSANNALPDKKIRLQMMRLIAVALNYRAESYVSPSTVTHIVRILQAKYPKELLCTNQFPESNPTCVLGSMGYFMSMLEQIGYINRFFLTYCNDLDIDKKIIPSPDCDHKVNDKYLPRFKDALENYRLSRRPTSGGSRIKKRRKSLKTKTRRLGKMTKRTRRNRRN